MIYTHWAYFPTFAAAAKCAAACGDLDGGLHLLVQPYDDRWLLRYARTIDLSGDYHLELSRLVVACGGGYDGGSSGNDVAEALR